MRLRIRILIADTRAHAAEVGRSAERRRSASTSRTTTDIRPVRISPGRAAATPSALLTASREAPVQPASSSWENGSAISTPSGVGLAEALGQLHQPGRDPAGGVVRAELDPLAVGVAQLGGEHAHQQERHPAVRAQVSLERGQRHAPAR